MLKHLGPIAATGIVILFLLVSSLPLMHWFETEGRDAALASNRDRWDQHGIRSYRMTVEMRCDCPGFDRKPLRMTIRDGVAAVEGDSEYGPMPPPYPGTVAALFDVIDDVINGSPDVIDIRYDEDYGFPTEINIDPDKRVPGDEVRYLVSAFDPRPFD